MFTSMEVKHGHGSEVAYYVETFMEVSRINFDGSTNSLLIVPAIDHLH